MGNSNVVPLRTAADEPVQQSCRYRGGRRKGVVWIGDRYIMPAERDAERRRLEAKEAIASLPPTVESLLLLALLNASPINVRERVRASLHGAAAEGRDRSTPTRALLILDQIEGKGGRLD